MICTHEIGHYDRNYGLPEISWLWQRLINTCVITIGLPLLSLASTCCNRGLRSAFANSLDLVSGRTRICSNPLYDSPRAPDSTGVQLVSYDPHCAVSAPICPRCVCIYNTRPLPTIFSTIHYIRRPIRNDTASCQLHLLIDGYKTNAQSTNLTI